MPHARVATRHNDSSHSRITKSAAHVNAGFRIPEVLTRPGPVANFPARAIGFVSAGMLPPDRVAKSIILGPDCPVMGRTVEDVALHPAGVPTPLKIGPSFRSFAASSGSSRPGPKVRHRDRNERPRVEAPYQMATHARVPRPTLTPRATRPIIGP